MKVDQDLVPNQGVIVSLRFRLRRAERRLERQRRKVARLREALLVEEARYGR